MLPTGTSSNEIAQAVGVSVTVGGVPVTVSLAVAVGPPGVCVDNTVPVLAGVNVGVSVGGAYVGSGIGVGVLVAVGVEVSQGLK